MELGRLKQLLGIDEGDTSKDVSLSFVISDVEEIIKNYCHIEEVPDGLLNTAYRMAIDLYRNEKPGRVLFHLLVRVILPYHLSRVWMTILKIPY